MKQIGTSWDRNNRNIMNENFTEAERKVLEQKDRVDRLIQDSPQPSEVVDARGEHAVLGDRLNDFTAQLAQIDTQLLDVKVARNVLDFGVKNDGTDTELALNSLESGYTYVFPSGTYGVKGYANDWYGGFKPKSSTKYVFLPGAKIKVLANDSRIYTGIHIHNVQNFELVNPVIEGDRLEHTFTEGTHEWGHGMFIEGVVAGTIINPQISNTMGDGLTINTLAGSDIYIQRGFSKNARRNGLAIISADKLVIDDFEADETNGIDPQAGIDIEPNATNCIMNHVVLNRVKSKNNALQGLVITRLDYVPNFNIEINECVVDGLFLADGVTTKNGKMIVRNPIIKGGSYGLRVDGNPNATITHPIIEIAPEKVSPITIPSPIFFISSIGCGDIDIIDAEILNTETTLSPIYFETPSVENVNVSFYKTNIKRAINQGICRQFVNCDIGLLPNVVRNYPTGVPLGNSHQLNKIKVTNKGATTFQAYRLNDEYHLVDIFEAEFEVVEPFEMQIMSGSGRFIYPFGTSVVKSKEKGAIIRLKFNGGNFYVTNMIGNWTGS